MSGTKPLIAGNWKMNGVQSSLTEIDILARALANEPAKDCEVLICPPTTLLREVVKLSGGGLVLAGGQNCHIAESGAHTGDISATMLADAGAQYVIVGHSERRHNHHETDGVVREKAEAAIKAGLIPIICVGETLAERSRGVAETVVEHQLDGSTPDMPKNSEGVVPTIVIAYEPVWAIGTGETASTKDIEQMHASIRRWLLEKYPNFGAQVQILYGGSMKPGNASEILSIDNVNGGLVGNASLNAVDFLAIVRAA